MVIGIKCLHDNENSDRTKRKEAHPMKKTTKKLLALLLSAVLLLGLLAACAPAANPNPGSSGNPGSSTNPEDDPLINNKETIKLTIFSQTANWSGAQTGWAATLFKDLFNVELNIIPDTDGAYQTRMEKGDLGDIVIWGTNGDKYANAVKAGLLFDWEEEDLLDNYGKYIKETFPKALEANREISGDGHVYGTGYALVDKAGQHDTFIYDWGIRWDLYKELGYPEVKDLDGMVGQASFILASRSTMPSRSFTSG